MRVVVVTTSYPRPGLEFAGRFVADAVVRLREAGVETDVVAPGTFRDFGAATGEGVLAGLRRRPWVAPALLASLALAVRRSARNADLVHAHWLPTAAAALFARVPYVVTLHGSDVELARRAPAAARAVLGRARGVIAVSSALADEARALGADAVTVVPNGVELPPEPGVEAEPAYVLFAGRLAPEKGVEELAAAAADGLPLVVAGDGPLRRLLPDALGFVPRPELERLLAGAAAVAVPSRREGFGLLCAEAMAYGRAVVATDVGGLRDLVRDGETGLLVPPRDPVALRAALERLLADADLRARLGAAAREHVRELCAWDRVTAQTIAVYERAVGG